MKLSTLLDQLELFLKEEKGTSEWKPYNPDYKERVVKPVHKLYQQIKDYEVMK